MFRKITLTLLILAAIQWSAVAKTIKVAGAFYQPFFFPCDKGYCGLDIDILNAFKAFYPDCTFEIKAMPFHQVIEAVKNGTVDMAIGAIYITEERKKWFHYTTPYLKTELVVVTRTGNRYASLSDLRKKTVCVKRGATGEKIARSLKEKYSWNIVVEDETDKCFEDVVNGKADALFNDYYNSVFIIAKRYLGKLTILRNESGYIRLQTASIAFPVSKGREELLEKLNRVISGLYAIGKLDDITSKWFPVGLIETYNRSLKKVITTSVLWSLAVSSVIIIIIGVIFYFKEKRREFQLYKSLLNAIPIAVFIINNKGKVVYSNPHAQEILDNVPAEEIERAPEEFRIRVGDEIRWFYKRESDLPDGSKIISMNDITHKKAAEREKELLRQQAKMETLGQITYQLAHDFNNVMHLVINSLNMVKEQLPHEDPAHHLVQSSLEECLKMSQFASKLVEFAKSPLEKTKPINLREFIESWKESIKRIAGRNVTVRFNLKETGLIAATESALTQVLINLITNAKDATSSRKRPEITISTGKTEIEGERFAVLEVRDNGTGIPDNIRDKIFNPFFTTKPEGSGVGLFTVFTIVKGLGGEIEVESSASGTVFRIYLPSLE